MWALKLVEVTVTWT